MLKVEGFLKENFGDMLKIDEHSVNMFTVSLKSISPRVVSLTWKY